MCFTTVTILVVVSMHNIKCSCQIYFDTFFVPFYEVVIKFVLEKKVVKQIIPDIHS